MSGAGAGVVARGTLDFEQFVAELESGLNDASLRFRSMGRSEGAVVCASIMDVVRTAREAATSRPYRITILPGHVRSGCTGTVIGTQDGCNKVVLDGSPGLVVLVPQSMCAPEGTVTAAPQRETVDVLYKRHCLPPQEDTKQCNP